MKRLFLSILTVAWMSGGAVWAEGKTLNIAATEWPPFYGAELEDNGFMSEIIRTAFDRSGYAAEIEFLPWKRALSSAQTGKHDALYTVWFREERKEWFLFSEALPANELVFFKRKESEITSSEYGELKDYTIGVVRGYAPPPGFEEAGLSTALSNNDSENLRKLAKGRVDLVLTDRIVAQHIINTEMKDVADELEWIDPPVHSDIQYLVVSKMAEDSEAILSDFNAGLAEITADGTLSEIMAKHGF